MLVKDFIVDINVKWIEGRLKSLQEMGAPDVMLKSNVDLIENLKSKGVSALKIGGSKHLLDKEYVSHIVTKGAKGKPVIIFNGNIKYAPHAAYGQFITECSGK